MYNLEEMRRFFVKILRGSAYLWGKLPLRFHYVFCNFFTWILRGVMKYRYDVIMTNLARSFPQLKYHELAKIADGFYKHLSEIFVEAIWFGASTYKRLYNSGIVTITNPEVFNQMFENTPNTTVLFSHCGNWELLGGVLGFRTSTGEKMAFEEKHIRVVYKALSNKTSDEFFRLNRVAPLEKVGVECEIESSKILRNAIKNRNDKAVYIYIADQYPYSLSLAHPIGEFMHQQTNAMLGGAGVAHKLGHSVVYLKMKHLCRGKYEMTFVPICDDASKMLPEDIMRKYFDILQEEINETPHNWLWSHKRWK